ncbi:restriction endonuclease subunit S [Nostoc sp. FACHB-87]|uniref:restriction endonuclease subunit S n=1 Tax=Nostocaceae TaxID=1162 RepID=UPI001686724B|nr:MULTISPECIES: restriction endonuclease subunit S [Nostocaceae]MBD2458176.1 restriction endonuclease subunit S [Nostoc sp. FACHB-87]MBD2479391.1 restriction endonuclease subunit S [Anabaena sp. FACHB-83]
MSNEITNIIKLPNKWQWAILSELISPLYPLCYGVVQPGNEVKEGVPLIRVCNIHGNGINLESLRTIDHKVDKEYKRSKVYGGELLISIVGTIGRVAIVPIEARGANIARAIAKIVLVDEIDVHWAALWFQTPIMQDSLVRGAREVARKTLNLSTLETVTLPLPPLNEQRRIVAKVESLKARSQRVKDALEDIPQLLDQFRQSVLAAAFRGDLTADWREQNPDVEPASVLLERIRAERRRRWEEAEWKKMEASGKLPKDDKWKDKYKEPEAFSNEELPKIPEGWIWTDINNISFVVRGASPRPAGDPKYFGGNIPWITVAEITKDDEIYLTQTSGFVTEEGCKASRFIEPGTFLLTNSGATLGVPKITKIGGCINDGSVALLFVNGEIQIYLYYFLTTLTQTLRKINQGAAQPNLNTEIVRNIKIPIPPQEELQVIIKLLNHQISTVSELKTLVNNKLELAVTLDQSILAKAFRGELVNQDPNDEPASVLLERIRTERDKLQTKTVKKSTANTSTQRTKKQQLQGEEAVQLELGLE